MERYLKLSNGIIIDTANKYYNLVSEEEFERIKEEKEYGSMASYIEGNIWHFYCESDGCAWIEHILAKSDNPMELCDKVVILDYDFFKPIDFNSLEEAQKFLWEHNCKEEDYTIKGANWMNNGLIYVVHYDSKTKECRLG